MIPQWASERIAREVAAWLDQARADASLTELVRRLQAWPVYADMGGSLLIGVDGQVYGLDHSNMEDGPERDPKWRLQAWVAAAERVPELRAVLPTRSDGVPDCPFCGGAGKITVAKYPLWCGNCSGLGWQGGEAV